MNRVGGINLNKQIQDHRKPQLIQLLLQVPQVPPTGTESHHGGIEQKPQVQEPFQNELISTTGG